MNNQPIPHNSILVVCLEDDYGFWADGDTYEQISEWFFIKDHSIMSNSRCVLWDAWQTHFQSILYVTGRGD